MKMKENHVGIKQESGLHIFIEQSEASKLMDATVPLRWCICPDIYQRLKEKAVKKPQLLLVVVDEFRGEERKLIPLENMMDYNMFQRPGKHRIFAAIVWDEEDDVKSLKKCFLSKNGWDYKCSLLDYEKTQWVYKPSNLVGAETIDAEVPKQFFAKEPPVWLEKWVNLIFFKNNPPKDQCQFRRRCIYAFTLQPFLLIIVAVVFVVFFLVPRSIVSVALFLLVGLRKINFSACIDTDRSLDNIWCDVQGSFFTSDSKGNSRLYLLPFMPIILLVLFGMVYLPIWIFGLEIGSRKIILIVFLIILAIEFFVWIIYSIMKSTGKIITDVRKKNEGKRIESLYENTFAPLVCTGTALAPNIDTLPIERQTIHLRFWNLKRKVCKPFARS